MSSQDMAAYMRLRRQSRRQKLIDLLGSKCMKCSAVENLEFNHRDRTQRLFNLSGKALDGRWEIILEELAKCDLLCQSCHLQVTKAQYASGNILPWNKGISGVEFFHGTARMYSEKVCRCNLCKTAKRLYRAKLISYTELIDPESSKGKTADR